MTTPSDLTEYYRAVAPVLLVHLAGRPTVRITTAGDVSAPQGAPVPASERAARDPVATPSPMSGGPPASVDELLAEVARGTVGFRALSGPLIVLRLTPGEGSDIATAATAALALAEQLSSDGLGAVALTDGSDGLLVMARTYGDPAAAAARYAQLLTDSAPELATADPAQADGRTLVDASASGGDRLVPVPYTLIDGPRGVQPVVPLHLDEVAAITAGMPLVMSASDVPDRIAARGDLAAPLLNTSTA